MFCLEIFNYFKIILFQSKVFEITDINTDLFVGFFSFNNKMEACLFL